MCASRALRKFCRIGACSFRFSPIVVVFTENVANGMSIASEQVTCFKIIIKFVTYYFM